MKTYEIPDSKIEFTGIPGHDEPIQLDVVDAHFALEEAYEQSKGNAGEKVNSQKWIGLYGQWLHDSTGVEMSNAHVWFVLQTVQKAFAQYKKKVDDLPE